jgi:hypothetical protein
VRTFALRASECVAVVAVEWCDAFGVVTSGRVQLEQRDGKPGPTLGRGAGFWLRGTGVRALRNPGHTRATVRIVTPADIHMTVNASLEQGPNQGGTP